MHRTRVIFFPVKAAEAKLQKLARAARYHFFRKEHFLLQVPDKKAAEYVDDLLWKMPAEGFLPHVQADAETEDFVVITEKKKNLNNAKFVFNLCPTPLILEDSFRLIYEFEDLSTPSRQTLSRNRYHAYREAKYIIESR